MESTGNGYGSSGSAADVLALLPDGAPFVLKRPYTTAESQGVIVLVVISCISATAVLGLLLAIGISAYNTRKSKSQTLFVRSHVAAYFISLLLCDVAQTVGSIMNIRWVDNMAVTYEPYCTAQGVIKHISDVGTAYWSMIIAMNTFWILFLRWRLRRHVLIAAILGGWSAIGAIISAGPAAIQRVDRGPFYAISGYWCWIGDSYPSQRITLDYMIMFLSALFSFLMYMLVFLRLRGNILVHGWHISFHIHRNLPDSAPRSVDTHVINIAKGMLLYPVAYTILLLPIAICRFAEWTGHEVPFAATIFSDAIFLLSGFVNVVLFLTTRRVLPMYSVFPRRFAQFIGSTASESRSSTYTTSSLVTDIEKFSPSCDESMTSRDAPLSALASAAPILDMPRSPRFTIGSAHSETFEPMQFSRNPAGRQISFTEEADSAKTRYYGSRGGDIRSDLSSPTSAIP